MYTVADRMERALDDALSMTFPASDPIAVSAFSTHLLLDAREPPAGSADRLPLVATKPSIE